MADYRGTSTPQHAISEAGYPDNFRLKSGFQIGLIADCPIGNAFAIQPGARFSMQGFTDEYKNVYSNIRSFSLFYLQVPVYVQYRLNIAEEINMLFQTGPYGSIGLFGRQSWSRRGKTQEFNDDKQKKITFGNGTAEDIHKAFDCGVSAGVGIEFVRFQFMLNYDFGLSKATFDKKNAKSTTYLVDMRNHNFSATLAVIFGRIDPLHNKD
jgi:hypothetical protein